MNKTETLQILAIIKAAYPNTFRDQTKEEATGTVNIWCLQFADTPAELVMMAVQKLISRNKFPPTIAEVKAKLSSIHWEAYEVVHSIGSEAMSKKRLAQFEAIYKATQNYKYPAMTEPGLGQMLESSDMRMIGSGRDDQEE